MTIFQSSYGQFYQTVGTATLTGGQATFTTPVLDSQYGDVTHTFMAIYLGGGGFAPSQSADLPIMVQRAAATVALSSSSNPSVFGQAVTFTATVTTPNGAPFYMYGGGVSFYDGSTYLGGGGC